MMTVGPSPRHAALAVVLVLIHVLAPAAHFAWGHAPTHRAHSAQDAAHADTVHWAPAAETCALCAHLLRAPTPPLAISPSDAPQMGRPAGCLAHPTRVERIATPDPTCGGARAPPR